MRERNILPSAGFATELVERSSVGVAVVTGRVQKTKKDPRPGSFLVSGS